MFANFDTSPVNYTRIATTLAPQFNAILAAIAALQPTIVIDNTVALVNGAWNTLIDPTPAAAKWLFCGVTCQGAATVELGIGAVGFEVLLLDLKAPANSFASLVNAPLKIPAGVRLSLKPNVANVQGELHYFY